MRRLFNQIHFRVLKLAYDGGFVATMHDKSWQEPLLSAVAPKANSRVLSFGQGSGAIAHKLAIRFSTANIVGADPNPKSVEKIRRAIAASNIANLTIIEAPLLGRLPFEACSFDGVVLVFTLHDRAPDEKLEIAKEMLRLVRHGGELHVAEYDKPVTGGELRILSLAAYISGPAAVEPHINGSWTALLTKVGFAGIRRQSSHSIGVGRISVVKARRP